MAELVTPSTLTIGLHKEVGPWLRGLCSSTHSRCRLALTFHNILTFLSSIDPVEYREFSEHPKFDSAFSATDFIHNGSFDIVGSDRYFMSLARHTYGCPFAYPIVIDASFAIILPKQGGPAPGLRDFGSYSRPLDDLTWFVVTAYAAAALLMDIAMSSVQITLRQNVWLAKLTFRIRLFIQLGIAAVTTIYSASLRASGVQPIATLSDLAGQIKQGEYTLLTSPRSELMFSLVNSTGQDQFTELWSALAWQPPRMLPTTKDVCRLVASGGDDEHTFAAILWSPDLFKCGLYVDELTLIRLPRSPFFVASLLIAKVRHPSLARQLDYALMSGIYSVEYKRVIRQSCELADNCFGLAKLKSDWWSRTVPKARMLQTKHVLPILTAFGAALGVCAFVATIELWKSRNFVQIFRIFWLSDA